MPKPIKRQGLSFAVKKALEEHGGKKTEHRFTIPEASDALLSRLKLGPERLAKARMTEAHSLRLQESIIKAEQGKPLTMGTARKIVETAARQIPEYLKRNKASKQQAQSLEILGKNLQRDLKNLDEMKINLEIELSPQFINTAILLNFNELKSIMGEKSVKRYANAMRKTQSILKNRKK